MQWRNRWLALGAAGAAILVCVAGPAFAGTQDRERIVFPGRTPGAPVSLRATPARTAPTTLAPPAPPSTARLVAAEALHAAERGTLVAWADAWRTRLVRTPGDRLAVFAVATAERLAYDFRGADARLARLATAGAAGVADEITRQAQVARAAMDAVQGRHAATAPRLQVIEGGALAAGDTAGALDALLLRSAVALRLEGATPAQLLMARGDSLGWDRDPALAAASRCRWAAIRSRQGRRDEARRLARTGAALAADAGLRRQAAGCLFILATEFARSGLTDSLRATLVPAMDAQRAAGDLAGLAASSQWAGYYAITLGHFSAAQRYLADAWALAARAQVADVAAWTALNRAALALSFHDAAATRQWMHRADTLMRRLDDPTGRLEVARLLARHAEAVGDSAAARLRLQEAQRLADRVGEPQLRLSVVAARRVLAMRGGELDEAAALMREERALIERHGLDGWRVSLGAAEGELALRRGDSREARRLLTRALDGLHASQHHFRFYTEVQLALSHALDGDGRAAARVALEAGESMDRWRASLGDSTLRQYTVQAQRSSGWFHSMLAARLVALGETEVAFLLAERRRARELQDRLLLASAWGGDGGVPRVAPVVTATPSLAAMRRALPDARTAIVTLDLGEGGAPGLAFVLTADSLTAHVLPSHDVVAPTLRRLVAQLERGGAADADARRLGDWLLVPLLPRLARARVERLVFVPEGVLHRLPFDVLQLPDGRPLLAHYESAVVPSVAVLAQWREAGDGAGRVGGAPRVVAVADPARGASGWRALELFSSSATAASLPPLPGARDEARRVQRAFPGATVLQGMGARERLVRAQLAGADVVHFATHAAVDEWSGARATLVLAPGDSAAGDDGALDAGEIAMLRLRAALVVLSACRTVGGEVVAGEGVRGLTGAFLQAGARRVVATAWRVDDRAVAPLMGDLYDALARGEAVGGALRSARLRAWQRGDGASVWGAFTLVGDPTGAVAPAGLRPARGVSGRPSAARE